MDCRNPVVDRDARPRLVPTWPVLAALVAVSVAAIAVLQSLHKVTVTKGGADIEAWETLGYRFVDGKVAEIWTFAYDQRMSESVVA